MFDFPEQSYQLEYSEDEEDGLGEVQKFLEESHQNAKERIVEDLKGEKQDLKSARKNFKENIELIYDRIDELNSDIRDLTLSGVEPERERKQHLEDELFRMYRRLLDQKDRWMDTRTEIRRRIRDLERELQELRDSEISDEIV